MKAEIKITITRVIELNEKEAREIYGPNNTPESILVEEIRFAEELPHEFMDAENVEWKTEGRILPDEV